MPISYIAHTMSNDATPQRIETARDWPSEWSELNDVSGSVHVIAPTITKFTFVVGASATMMEFPLPPPRLHFSTWWRRLTRKLYKASQEQCVQVDAN